MKTTNNNTEYVIPQVDIYLTEPAEMLCTSVGTPDVYEEEYEM